MEDPKPVPEPKTIEGDTGETPKERIANESLTNNAPDGNVENGEAEKLDCSPEEREEVQLSDQPEGSPVETEAENTEADPSLAGLEGVQGAEGGIPEDSKAAPGQVNAETSATGSPTASPRATCEPVQAYHVKWVTWRNKNTPIITQNENGPCPLIAVLNVLLLRETIQISQMVEIVSARQLFEYLGDHLLSRMPKDASDDVTKNYEQNMHDAMEIMSRLQTGLDVNVKFTGVKDFEYTQECVVFDLLNIALYHGWLYDPQNLDIVSAVGTCSYNQLVEKIIASKTSSDESVVRFGLIAEQFLASSASQLTYHGLCELNSTIQEEELCVLFRNNHFSTLYKHNNELYVLVTDQGFLTESNVVWETLSNIEGDSYFVDGNFRRRPTSTGPLTPPPPMSTTQQIDTDLLLALSLQENAAQGEGGNSGQQPASTSKPQPSEVKLPDGVLTDHQLAMQLQQEEDYRIAQQLSQNEQEQQQQQQQQQQPQQAAQPRGGARHRQQVQPSPRQPAAANGNGGSRRREEKSCTIL